MAARAPAPQVSGLVTRPVLVQKPGTYGSANPAAPARSVPLQATPVAGVPIKLEKFLGRPDLDINTARALDQLQTNLAAAIRQASDSPLARVEVHPNIALSAGGTVLQHGLGTTPTGVAIDSFLGGLPAYSVGLYTSTTVTIVVSQNCTGRVLVFG
jgi:hypothetical protein